jgi:hypothetical protein
VHAIRVIDKLDFATSEVLRRVEHVTVSGFTVRGFTGSGVVAVAAHGTTSSGGRPPTPRVAREIRQARASGNAGQDARM